MAKKKRKKKAAPKEPEFKVKRIRMLINCANQYRAFSPGDVLLVPEEISVNTAKSWIKTGAAEEDTSLDVPEETK